MFRAKSMVAKHFLALFLRDSGQVSPDPPHSLIEPRRGLPENAGLIITGCPLWITRLNLWSCLAAFYCWGFSLPCCCLRQPSAWRWRNICCRHSIYRIWASSTRWCSASGFYCWVQWSFLWFALSGVAGSGAETDPQGKLAERRWSIADLAVLPLAVNDHAQGCRAFHPHKNVTLFLHWAPETATDELLDYSLPNNNCLKFSELNNSSSLPLLWTLHHNGAFLQQSIQLTHWVIDKKSLIPFVPLWLILMLNHFCI